VQYATGVGGGCFDDEGNYVDCNLWGEWLDTFDKSSELLAQ